MAMKFGGFSPQQMQLLLPKLGYKGSMQTDEIDMFLAASPRAASQLGRYTETARQMVEGKPVNQTRNMANGGFVFPRRDNMGNASRLNSQDNPEYSESLIDIQAAAVNKLENTFPTPQQEEQRRFAVGGVSDPMNLGDARAGVDPIVGPPPPVVRNPRLDAGYYDSPEFNDFRTGRNSSIDTMDVVSRPDSYTGQIGGGSFQRGRATDAYENYLNRTGKTNLLVGGADYVEPEGLAEYLAKQAEFGPLLQAQGPNDVLSRGQYNNNPPPMTPRNPFDLSQAQATNPQAEEPLSARAQATAPPVGPVDYTQGPVPQSTGYQGGTITDAIANRAFTPGLPYGGTVSPVGTAYNANQAVDTTLGQVTGTIAPPTASATTSTAAAPTAVDPRTMTASTTAESVQAATNAITPAQGTVDPRATVTGEQTITSSVEDLNAAQGTATTMSNPVTRSIQAGEVISGVANAETASTFTEQVQAATATPSNKATIQGQLEGLMQAFEGGNTPAWAAGAMRNVSAQMANRGLGASSMAAQALIQGAMESALPIAQADAQVVAKFESQNLSNRQQRAMLAAEQRATFMGMEFTQEFQARVQNSARIGDIANMNFTADQQVALENSRIANTVNLSNLSNSQAMIMAEASALANLDMSNLANRQQAAVQNAQNFMQMDMQNLSNQQQTDMFKGQQIIQSLFTDQAAENAAKQFNATSQSQTDQFFASLSSTTSQFNASQSNAQEQFNAGQSNTMGKFVAEVQNQRDQFNAQNRLVIDQNNAQWRREIATADTVAINRANELNASSILEMSDSAYKNLWQYYSDSMEWAWNSAENEQERWNRLALQQMQNDTSIKLADMKSDYQSSTSFGKLIGTLFTGGNKIFGSLTGGTSSLASVTT